MARLITGLSAKPRLLEHTTTNMTSLAPLAYCCRVTSDRLKHVWSLLTDTLKKMEDNRLLVSGQRWLFSYLIFGKLGKLTSETAYRLPGF